MFSNITRRTVLRGSVAALASGFLMRGSAFGQTQGPLAPWFGPGGDAAGASLTLNHGLNLGLSGPGADVGIAMSRGAQVAADLIKASGGPTINLKINDHQGLVPESATGVRRMISREGITSLGSSYGACTEALFPLVANSDLFTFWSGGANPNGLSKKNVWITMALFAVDPAPGALAYLAKRYPDAKRLALIGQQENGLPALKEIAPKVWPQVSGGEIVASELVNLGTTDFSSLIARLKSASVEAIFSTVWGSDQGYMIRQLRDAGITAPIMNIDLITPTVPNIAGDAIAKDCYLAVDGFLPDNANPYNQLFVEAFKKQHGEAPDYFAANFFEATNILWSLVARAVKAGKDPKSGAALSEVLAQDPSFPSVYGGNANTAGKMVFDVENHSVTKPLGVFEIQTGGKLNKVATIEKNSTEILPA